MNFIKHGLSISLLLLLFALLNSCTNPRYINSPSVHNAAFLKQQGDFKFSVAGAGNPAKIFKNIDDDPNDETLDHSYGFDGQAAVALTNHFMITASGTYRNERDKYSNDDLSILNATKVSYNRRMFDIGAGFYTPMGRSEKVYFNGVIGVGLGNMSSSDDAHPYDVSRHRTYDANVVKYFLHPSFNFFFSDYMRMSVAPRFSILKLHNIHTTYSNDEEITLGYIHARNHTFGLFEPAILLQAGFRNNDWLKLDMGFNFSSDPFTSKNNDYPSIDTYRVESRNFLFSIGLSFYPMGKR